MVKFRNGIILHARVKVCTFHTSIEWPVVRTLERPLVMAAPGAPITSDASTGCAIAAGILSPTRTDGWIVLICTEGPNSGSVNIFGVAGVRFEPFEPFDPPPFACFNQATQATQRAKRHKTDGINTRLATRRIRTVNTTPMVSPVSSFASS